VARLTRACTANSVPIWTAVLIRRPNEHNQVVVVSGVQHTIATPWTPNPAAATIGS
jgi:hypothetical protein